MLTQGQSIPNKTVKRTQVCIIGAGPAGITLAWYLNKAGIKVILLEGSRDFGPFDQKNQKFFLDKINLYNGKVGGLLSHNEPSFLINPTPRGSNKGWERERYFGGSSLHWGGQCRPLDPITFEQRKNFPRWPINRKDLDPFYQEAFKFCNLYGSEEDPDNWEQYFDAEFWASKNYLDAKVPDLLGMQVDMYQFLTMDDQKKFNQKKVDGKTLEDSGIEVIVNATLLEIDKAKGNVSRIKAASMTMDIRRNIPPQVDTQFYIEAESYVLACGGVANARQLLLNDIGKKYDQVGRNFITQSVVPNAIDNQSDYLDPAETRLMSGKTKNGESWTEDSRNRKYQVALGGRIVPKSEIAKELGIARCWFREPGNSYFYWEQSPNVESRICLSDTLDPVFHQRQTKAIWKVNDQDEINFDILIDLFRNALWERKAKLTSVISWETLTSTAVVNGHHLGTTRMSDTPEDGVVDKNLKVHELKNLYVAGSSVFTTGGLANPTFTIIALSIRLAAHLSTQLSRNTVLSKSL